jgi:hypothetical protein
MNWFDKIKELTTKKDSSPELKKGEIKNILIRTAADILPDFDFLSYNKSCYTFQRLRKSNELTAYETLHIIFTLKGRNFACSVASRLNPTYINANSYNTGLVNPHTDLKVLRFNKGTLNIQDAYYFHNGQVETTTNTVKKIFNDFKKYGLLFLDKQFKRIQLNEIIKAGLNYIDKLQVDKEKLKSEIENELNKGGHQISSIQQPTYLDLKETLQKVTNQSKDDRKLISKSAYELLELYWAK